MIDEELDFDKFINSQFISIQAYIKNQEFHTISIFKIDTCSKVEGCLLPMVDTRQQPFRVDNYDVNRQI